MIQETDVETLEIELLLEGLYRRYGFDFREYALASIRRRIWNIARADGVPTITALHVRLLHDPEAMERSMLMLTDSVNSVFRDPGFYLAIREKVVPLLQTYPFVRVWHAGCSTGEAVYAMAILLQEEGLYERARLYATDMNGHVLKKARDGIFALDHLPEYESNYRAAGGKGRFADHVISGYGVIFPQALQFEP